MSLTTKEKDHWKERIEKKIEKRIAYEIDSKDRGYLRNIRSEAYDQAIKRFNLMENRSQQNAIKFKIEKLTDELKQLRLFALVACTQLNDSEIARLHDWDFERLTESSIEIEAKKIERKLMEKDELGRTIIKLQDEQEQLLDTVWLATSTKQIRDLWQNVANLLDQEPTELQAKSMGSILED